MKLLPEINTEHLPVTTEANNQAALFQAMKLERNIPLRFSVQVMQALYHYTDCYEKTVVADVTDTEGMLLKRMMTKVKRRVGKRMLIMKKEYSLSLPSDEATAFCEAIKVLKVTGIYEKTNFNHIRDLILKYYA